MASLLRLASVADTSGLLVDNLAGFVTIADLSNLARFAGLRLVAGVIQTVTPVAQSTRFG